MSRRLRSWLALSALLSAASCSLNPQPDLPQGAPGAAEGPSGNQAGSGSGGTGTTAVDVPGSGDSSAGVTVGGANGAPEASAGGASSTLSAGGANEGGASEGGASEGGASEGGARPSDAGGDAPACGAGGAP